MTAVLVRMLGLCLLMTCFTGVAVAYGRAQPEHPTLYGLDKCNEFPCFMGLDFRKIGHRAVYAHMIGLPGSRIISDSNSWIDIPNSDFSYLVLFSGSVRDGIILIPQSKMLTLGDFINFYGQPCGMTTSDPIPTTILLYPSMTVTVEFEGQYLNERLNHATPIQQIVMWNPDAKQEYYEPCNKLNWQGFTSLRHYWDSGLVWPGD